jgi:hypothetical protein
VTVLLGTNVNRTLKVRGRYASGMGRVTDASGELVHPVVRGVEDTLWQGYMNANKRQDFEGGESVTLLGYSISGEPLTLKLTPEAYDDFVAGTGKLFFMGSFAYKRLSGKLEFIDYCAFIADFSDHPFATCNEHNGLRK